MPFLFDMPGNEYVDNSLINFLRSSKTTTPPNKIRPLGFTWNKSSKFYSGVSNMPALL